MRHSTDTHPSCHVLSLLRQTQSYPSKWQVHECFCDLNAFVSEKRDFHSRTSKKDRLGLLEARIARTSQIDCNVDGYQTIK
jgi:hypothetical protein